MTPVSSLEKFCHLSVDDKQWILRYKMTELLNNFSLKIVDRPNAFLRTAAVHFSIFNLHSYFEKIEEACEITLLSVCVCVCVCLVCVCISPYCC
jgi:hypothetical protein